MEFHGEHVHTSTNKRLACREALADIFKKVYDPTSQ